MVRSSEAWYQGLIWRIVKVLGLLANTIMTVVLKTTLDASQAGSLITLIRIRKDRFGYE